MLVPFQGALRFAVICINLITIRISLRITNIGVKWDAKVFGIKQAWLAFSQNWPFSQN